MTQETTVWRPLSAPTIEVIGGSRAEPRRMTDPAPWLPGGVAVRVDIAVEAFIPAGAEAPDWDALQARIMEALRHG